MRQLQGVHDGESSAASAACANARTPLLTTHTRPDFNHAIPLYISHALLVSSSCTRQAAGTGVWVSSQDVRAHLGHVMKDKRTICLMDKMLGNALLAGYAVHQ